MNTIFLPIKTKPGLNAREHWRARASRTKSEREAAHLAFKATMRHGSALPCTITLVRLSAATMDDDNLPGAFKAIRDGIADALGVKDNNPAVTWRYDQRKCKHGEFGIIIEVAK